jgi:hypothetical protein
LKANTIESSRTCSDSHSGHHFIVGLLLFENKGLLAVPAQNAFSLAKRHMAPGASVPGFGCNRSATIETFWQIVIKVADFGHV